MCAILKASAAGTWAADASCMQPTRVRHMARSSVQKAAGAGAGARGARGGCGRASQRRGNLAHQRKAPPRPP